ncbi:MAG: hypothetical protein AMXMBFR84_22380 [Candidatus Hydrogenedentota bacterium]
MRHRSILLTGATGIMGSWVLAESLDRGLKPVVLMRDADPGTARRRLTAVMSITGRGHLTSRIRIVHGDACLPNLGISSRQRDELRRTLTALIHCAACTSFDSSMDEVIWDTNVWGVANVIDFLEGTGIPLYHVSTAYVAGTRVGIVRESDLDHGQIFKNTYEKSKLTAERMVRDAIASGRVQGSIFRPSIITGATGDGSICQFLNFYGFMRLVALLAERRIPCDRPIRVEANPHSTQNLVPVDWVARAMWTIIDRDGPSGRTFHLTNPNPLTHRHMMGWANGYCARRGSPGRLADVPRLNGDATPVERRTLKSMLPLRPYMFAEAVFDRSNTDFVLDDSEPFPCTDPAYLDCIMSHAVARKWQSVMDQKAANSKKLSVTA